CGHTPTRTIHRQLDAESCARGSEDIRLSSRQRIPHGFGSVPRSNTAHLHSRHADHDLAELFTARETCKCIASVLQIIDRIDYWPQPAGCEFFRHRIEFAVVPH